MAITSTSALLAALPGQRLNLFKQISAALGSNWANRWISLWTIGGNPVAGAAPGAQGGVIPTSATTGAPAFTNAGGSNTLYLGRCAPICASGMRSLVLYDRLLASSGFGAVGGTISPSGVVTVDRTAPADSGAFKNELWVEVYSQTAAVRTVSFNYTDQAGGSGNVSGTVTIPAATPSVMIPVPLAATDIGVKSVESLTLNAASGGNFGFTILRPLAEFSINPNTAADIQDAVALGMPDIPDDACLAFMALMSGNTVSDLNARTQLIEG